jgi:acyl carrier protein
MFRTGDLGRVDLDGQIEFLGRQDDQVKIRGYRVWLGEIEAIVSAHPDVREAVITSREVEDNTQLLAYIVRSNKELTTNHLRSYLSSRLPDFMVPSLFTFLPGLPMTSSGKVDRGALPAPGKVIAPEQTQSPTSAEEVFLTAVWAELLGVDCVGIDAHFLDIGGDSLFAVQVVASIWDKYDIELPVLALFQHPTVAELASLIRRKVNSHGRANKG